MNQQPRNVSERGRKMTVLSREKQKQLLSRQMRRAWCFSALHTIFPSAFPTLLWLFLVCSPLLTRISFSSLPLSHKINPLLFSNYLLRSFSSPFLPIISVFYLSAYLFGPIFCHFDCILHTTYHYLFYTHITTTEKKKIGCGSQYKLVFCFFFSLAFLSSLLDPLPTSDLLLSWYLSQSTSTQHTSVLMLITQHHLLFL